VPDMTVGSFVAVVARGRDHRSCTSEFADRESFARFVRAALIDVDSDVTSLAVAWGGGVRVLSDLEAVREFGVGGRNQSPIVEDRHP
jgi:hypothetical protein